MFTPHSLTINASTLLVEQWELLHGEIATILNLPHADPRNPENYLVESGTIEEREEDVLKRGVAMMKICEILQANPQTVGNTAEFVREIRMDLQDRSILDTLLEGKMENITEIAAYLTSILPNPKPDRI